MRYEDIRAAEKLHRDREKLIKALRNLKVVYTANGPGGVIGGGPTAKLEYQGVTVDNYDLFDEAMARAFTKAMHDEIRCRIELVDVQLNKLGVEFS